ncbi:thiamine pyrophosphate-binding protein [Nocardiopsis sp. CC223A]|uniref:thiamine pyrophosphate-binding protein n=1 Tax=Nocardiopsis sp. CC223A TaxID=3044051 RepID=UPI00278C71C8|nr:thiamine pyrophosphate-binding protein [Nocardiopsis sp. CC223A]
MLDAFTRAGVHHFTGVPCSLLKGLFHALEDAPEPVRYLPAPREDTALGVASGLAVAGTPAAVLMQNSGLGYCLNVITSFNLIYDVHTPLVVSWRGHSADAVEHDVIGRELTRLLDVFSLPWNVLDHGDPYGSVETCLEGLSQGPSVLIVREGI